MERKEAIDVIKNNWPDSSFTMLREALETLIPELKESEDERIRKELIENVRELSKMYDTLQTEKEYSKVQSWIAWLEKQGEQNPVWSEEDEKMLNDAIGAVGAADYYTYDDKQEIENWLKSLKERYTWKPSDDQIKVCKEVYADILSAKGFDLGTINSELNRMEEELKKLRENKYESKRTREMYDILSWNK